MVQYSASVRERVLASKESADSGLLLHCCDQRGKTVLALLSAVGGCNMLPVCLQHGRPASLNFFPSAHTVVHVSCRSIARFGQSLTRSFGRSAGSPVGVKSPAPGCYMDAAAAAAATDTHTGRQLPVLYPLHIRLSVALTVSAMLSCQLSFTCIGGRV